MSCNCSTSRRATRRKQQTIGSPLLPGLVQAPEPHMPSSFIKSAWHPSNTQHQDNHIAAEPLSPLTLPISMLSLLPPTPTPPPSPPPPHPTPTHPPPRDDNSVSCTCHTCLQDPYCVLTCGNMLSYPLPPPSPPPPTPVKPLSCTCHICLQDPYCVLTCGNIKLLSSVHKSKPLRGHNQLILSTGNAPLQQCCATGSLPQS